MHVAGVYIELYVYVYIYRTKKWLVAGHEKLFILCPGVISSVGNNCVVVVSIEQDSSITVSFQDVK